MQDEESAESAISALRGYVFFGKPLVSIYVNFHVQRLNFANKESDVIAKMRNTFDEENKAKREKRKLKEASIDYYF